MEQGEEEEKFALFYPIKTFSNVKKHFGETKIFLHSN